MKFTSLATVALLPFVLAAPTAEKVSSSAAQVISLIKPITGNVTDLAGVVDQAKGGEAYTTDQLLSIQSYSNNIAADVKTLTSKVKSSKPFDAADSKSISKATGPLDSDTLKLLNDFNTHYKSFTASGVDSSVLSSLKSQKTATATLTSAFESKLAAPEAASAKKEGAALAAEYSKVIKTYSQSS